MGARRWRGESREHGRGEQGAREWGAGSREGGAGDGEQGAREHGRWEQGAWEGGAGSKGGGAGSMDPPFPTPFLFPVKREPCFLFLVKRDSTPYSL